MNKVGGQLTAISEKIKRNEIHGLITFTTCQKCRMLDPSPELLDQILHLRRISGTGDRHQSWDVPI